MLITQRLIDVNEQINFIYKIFSLYRNETLH